MRWEGRRQSENIEDRKGRPLTGGLAIGGGIGTLILVLIVLFLGGDPRGLLQQAGPAGGRAGKQGEGSPATEQREAAEKELREFVGVVVADTEDVWNRLLPTIGASYIEPGMVRFHEGVESGCGMATSAAGPFYCPADQKVYIDLAFFEELQRKFKAPGDFAMAYVVAHEVGHHVQYLLGISEQVQRLQSQASKIQANELSVRLELQADFLAGVWAFHAQRMKNILERGDLEEALNAASHIGDDVLQKQATGRVQQEGFTHGSAAQRVRWLRAGLESGDLSKMNLLFEMEYSQL